MFVLTLAALLLGMPDPAEAGSWGQAFASGDANVTYSDVFFFDRSHGWIVGSDNGQGFVLHNPSGDPADWQAQSLPGGVTGLRRVMFISADEGWAAGDGGRVLHYTSGGGWVEQRTGSQSLSALFFLDASTGWVADDASGSVLATVDGGGIWSSPIGVGGRVFDLAFVSTSQGWAVTEQGLSNNNIWVTDTGGSIWWEAGLIPINNWMYGLEIVDADTVLAVGASGAIWRGRGPFLPDGSWSLIDNTAGSAELHDIDLAGADPLFGWAVGTASTIVHTIDGGANWTLDGVSPAGLDLAAVTAVDRGFAWAVGNGASGGVLLRFSCTDGQLDCTDQDTCTVGESCVAGDCVWGPADCSDGNPCTDDLCDSETGCYSVDNNAPCSDGDPCTVGDLCSGNACQPGAGTLDCDDGEACTDDFCQAFVGCQHADNSAACDDGNSCTLGDVCAGGSCQAGGDTPDCDDGNPCTDDGCDPGLGCQNTANGAVCDDGDPCTVGDVCSAAACQPGGGTLDCDDGEVCTDDTCLVGVGCQHADNTAGCDDGDACTLGDGCAGGTCQAGAGQLDCDDGNPCTDDSCDPLLGCQNTANGAACDDGNACTTGDVCSGGSCQAGQAVDCDDLNPCTDDNCLPASGCQHAENSDPCDDLDPCTMDDLCLSGTCTGQAKDSDGDGYVDQACGGNDCDDGQAAINPGVYESSFGQAPCADGLDNDCDGLTDQADLGCIQCNQDADCDDGDRCNGSETCAPPACLAGSPLDCDDGERCTDDACLADSGCTHQDNALPCDDGDLCTQGDVCLAGACQPGAEPRDCDDGIACTEDRCLPQSGCHNEAIDATCDDGQACTRDRCDMLLGCVSEAADEGEPCGVCLVCSAGACLPREFLSDCQSPDDCSGSCSPAQVCVVEGACGPVDLSACPEASPQVAWDAGVDCRLPTDAVDLQVDAPTTDAAEGGLLPVFVRLKDGMEFPLQGLVLRIDLRPGGPDRPGVAFVAGSARWSDGSGPMREVATSSPDLLALVLDPADADGVRLGLGVGETRSLTFLIEARDGPGGAFEISAWAPCQAPLEEVGCHLGYGQAPAGVEDSLPLGAQGEAQDIQRVSAAVLMSARGERLESTDDQPTLRSLQLGCQCGGGPDWFSLWAMILLFLWGIGRKRTP